MRVKRVRTDIVLFAFVLVIIVGLVNYCFPIEKNAYKQAEASGTEIGMPADSSVKVVNTMQGLEEANDEKGCFAIQVDKNKLTKTNYYFSNTYRTKGAFQSNLLAMGITYVFEDETFDRIYVVELEDGNRIPVRIFERALDLSDDTIILPIGKQKKLGSSYKPLESIDAEYDLTTADATKWYVDASGSWFRQNYIMDKASTGTRSWTIVTIGMILYMIVSTVVIVIAEKKQDFMRQQMRRIYDKGYKGTISSHVGIRISGVFIRSDSRSKKYVGNPSAGTSENSQRGCKVRLEESNFRGRYLF